MILGHFTHFSSVEVYNLNILDVWGILVIFSGFAGILLIFEDVVFFFFLVVLKVFKKSSKSLGLKVRIN